ncbi:MAG: AsmA family protein [Sheuella sp.]|nr:AsmA family protein [Sheuella sp.]
MKFWIRQIFVTLAAITVIAVCGLVAFLWTFDPNSYKDALQVMVQQRLDRQLTIKGDLKVVLFPDIAIQAKEVSLSNRGSDEIFASIDDLRATIALWPLLRNHVVIEEIALHGLKAQVQRAQLGDFVLDDLLGWGKPALPASKSGDVGLLMDDTSIDIAEILIKKSELTVFDADKHQSWKLHDMSLEFGRIKRGEPFKAELNARIQHAGSAAVAKISAQAVLNIDLASRAISAKNFNASFKGDFPESPWLENTLKKVDLSLVIPGLSITPDSGRLRLERLVMRAKGMRDGAPFEFSLDAPSLDVSNSFARSEMVTSRLRMDGSPAIDVRMVLDGLQGDRNKFVFERSNVDLAIKRDTRVFKFVLNAPLSVEPFASKFSTTGFVGDIQTIQAPASKSVMTLPVKGNFSVSLDQQLNQRFPLRVVAQAENIPFATVLSGLGVDSNLDGDAAFEVSSRFSTGSWYQMGQSASGSVQLRLKQASLRGVDLSEGLDALRTVALTDKQSVSLSTDRTKRTIFDSVELDLKVESGIANVTRLNMTAPGWNVKQGSPGKINFLNDTLDMNVWLHLYTPQSLTAKRVTIQVRSLLVPLQVTGDIASPQINIQWAAIDRDPVGRALKEKLLNYPVESHSPASAPNFGIQKK